MKIFDRICMIFAVILAISILIACAENPPKEEREAAEQAFLAAKAAEKCAVIAYTSAEKALLKARQLTMEKKYDEAKHYFVVAKNLSDNALKKANDNDDCMNPKDPAEEDNEQNEETTEPSMATDEMDDSEFVLEMVRFPFNSEEITEEAKEILQKNANWLQRHENIKVAIEGHCDKRGSTEYNLSLGERRAAAVKKYLILLNVMPDNIELLSYGEERPLLDEDSEEAYGLNRRVEFRKIK